MSGLSLALAARYAALGFDDLPAATVHAARMSLLDGLAVMLAATRLEPAAAPFAEHAIALGGGGRASLLGRPQLVSAPMAALANGALAHALDFEDAHDGARLHPNAALIPAVLALAEERRSDGRLVLLALAAGCDFACRLGLALDGDPAERGWYHPPMLSALGAALGAAILIGLQPQQMVAALSLAACQFALNDELKRSPNTHLRAVRDGFAARAAVEAVLLAERGVAGTDAPLEGRSGLFATLTDKPPLAPALLDGLGQRFEGEGVGIKLWPCCRGTHAGIAAALEWRGRGIAPEAIVAVAVAVAPPDDMLFVPTEQKLRPQSAIDARFSLPFTMAAALVHGAPDLRSFSEGNLADPRVLALARRIGLREVRRDLHGVETWATLSDGSVRHGVTAPPDGPVAGRAPFTDLVAKLSSCLANAGVATPAAALIESVAQLEVTGLDPILAALQARPQMTGGTSG